jgi:hypothetical protein
LECGDLSPLCAARIEQSGDKSPHSKMCHLPYMQSQTDLSKVKIGSRSAQTDLRSIKIDLRK